MLNRSISQIQADINHCKKQIASTYENQTPQNSQETEIIRNGFQIQLNKLNDEETKAIHNIRVINPRIYTTNGLQELDFQEHTMVGMDFQGHTVKQ